MKRSLINVAGSLLFLCSVTFFATCAKEYSYEGGPKKGGAIYSLVGAGDTCTGSVLAGNYYTNIALTAANTVQLQVDVTTVGDYSVGTSSADGFWFSGSGKFTTTGRQTVVLTGTGTPAATGNFVFTATAFGNCTFMVSIASKPVVMASIMLAGDPGTCTSPNITGAYVAGTALDNSNHIDVNVNVTSTGAYTITTDTLDGISFSASGTFTSTGNKAIQLVGTGTPQFARNLIFTPTVGHSTCTVKVSVTDQQPLGVYVIESGFGPSQPCMYTVAGAYTANTPLTASNTVRIFVYVATPGNFTIATAVVNGIMFSLSGTFTTTGEQTVVLTGSGTPLTAGSALFTPQIVGPDPLGGSGCGFTVTVQ